jgi:hypothetical protein
MDFDFSKAKALCETMGGTYDEDAVRPCRTMERLLDRLHVERFGHFAGILNAIENHVEEGDGEPSVVRHLGDALLALAAVHKLKPRTIKRLTQLLGQLHSHVADQAARRSAR